MAEFQLTSGIILITIGLFSLQTQLVSAAFTMSETCGYITKGWIADPSNCQRWGYCNGGRLVGTDSCDDGLLFDSTTGVCDFADKVNCMTTVDDVCQNLPNPQMIADPNDCRSFCYCDANNTTTCATCPINQYYNPSTGSCVWASTYDCPANSICRLVPNNQFAGDPSNCGNFIMCANGSGKSTACANGLYYNALSGFCQTANPCNDNGSSTGPPTASAGPGVNEPLPRNAAKCSKSTGTVEKPDFMADSVTCMGFYVCDGTATTGTWSKCPLGTHFNANTKQCVSPVSYICNYDRCGNMEQQFMTIATTTDSTCTTYINCRGQTAIPGTTGVCPQGFEYFNEINQNCTPVKPDFTICGP